MHSKPLTGLFAVVLFMSNMSFAQDMTEGRLDTGLTSITYSDPADLKAFLWKITGKRFILPEENDKAAKRVDKLVVRVMDVLDMRPPAFRVKIELMPVYESGYIASYSNSKKRILVYCDRVTDGVFAHELAHAIQCAYFLTPPPDKVQEIMCQYVDKNLWEDY